MRMLHAQPRRKFLLKLLGKAAGRQPEIQRRVGQRAHFLFVEHARRIGDAVALLKGRLLFLEIVIIVRHQRLDLSAGFLFAMPVRHIAFSSKLLACQRRNARI